MSVPEVLFPQQQSGLESLPNDLLLEIVGQLADPYEAVKAGLVSRYVTLEL